MVQLSIFPKLSHIQIYFLLKGTTPIVQPLDLGVIAYIKLKYRRRQCKHAVDLIESGIERNLYKVDIQLAITWFYDIWDRIPNRIIRNCWAKSKLIDYAVYVLYSIIVKVWLLFH